MEIVWSCTSWATYYWAWLMVFIVVDGLCFYCFFNYSTLLELQYGGRVWKSQITREQARKMGASVREAECRIDIRLFINEYPRWELGTPHWSVILHEMFLHAAERGRRRQNVWSTRAAKAAHQNLTQRLVTLPLSMWGIGHPARKSEIFIRVSIC